MNSDRSPITIQISVQEVRLYRLSHEIILLTAYAQSVLVDLVSAQNKSLRGVGNTGRLSLIWRLSD